MNKSKKFSILISLILITSVFLNIQAQNFSDKIPGEEEIGNYETGYTNQVCEGDSNIIKAGCSVIAGQVVRGVPAILFGASFDKIKKCVENMEQRSGTNATINLSDTCIQFGLYNPNIDTSKFVFVNSGNTNDYSLLGLTKELNKINQEIVQNSFDSSFFVFKAIENIPVAKSVFAQAEDLNGAGNFFRDFSYDAWVIVRNISYALIGLFSIILGLTLMSSNSIFDNNAKWRLSLEQAIPRVIIAIILIQFSFLLGETLLFIANNSNFEPIFRYVFGINDAGWAMFLQGLIPATPTAIIGAGLSTYFFGQALLVGLVIFGIWYVYRLLVIVWYNLGLILEVCLFTIGSPLIISMSLLPGEAGAQQTRRYFSTFLSLLSRTFLLQLITVGPTILLVLWVRYGISSFEAFATTTILSLLPLILSIIILGYADNVQNISNQFARNITGADPIGAQPQGR